MPPRSGDDQPPDQVLDPELELDASVFDQGDAMWIGQYGLSRPLRRFGVSCHLTRLGSRRALTGWIRHFSFPFVS